MPANTEQFIADALQNRFNRTILQRLPDLNLPDAWLVAGCLFQTVWNVKSARPPETGIKDYDLFYFDPADLSEAAETAVGQRVEACFADLGITVRPKIRRGYTPGTRLTLVSRMSRSPAPKAGSTGFWCPAPA